MSSNPLSRPVSYLWAKVPSQTVKPFRSANTRENTGGIGVSAAAFSLRLRFAVPSRVWQDYDLLLYASALNMLSDKNLYRPNRRLTP